MVMRIWNPSEFKIGQAGRSNCPKWRGQDYPFTPNELKEMPDACGRWMIREYAGYGLVSLPDRNIIRDNEEYDKAVHRLRTDGIRQLYKWAVRVVDQYRVEAKKCIDARERPPIINNFVKLATKIQKRYRPDVEMNDPELIADHQLMREIMGTVEHDSDKLLDQALTKELIDNEKNRQQYQSRDEVTEIPITNMPSAPTQPNPISDEARRRAANKKKKKRPGRKPGRKPNQSQNSPVNSADLPPIDLNDSLVIEEDGEVSNGGDPVAATEQSQNVTQ